MNISLELYKVFYYVAKNLSFSKAAEELFVTQSAISQSIKQLENKIGFPLLLRNTKNIYLTKDGDIFFSYLEQAFAIIEKAEKNLYNRQSLEEGEITIASTDTLCIYHLLPKIKELNTLYPKFKIKIINETSKKCIKLLEKAVIDFAVVNITEDLDENIFLIQKYYEFRDVFVANKNYSFSSASSLKEVAQCPLLVLDQKSVTRYYFDRLFETINIKITPEIELQSVDLLIEMTKAGLGVAFIPDICMNGNKHDLQILNLKEEIPKRKYGIVSHIRVPLAPIGKIFVDMF